MYGSWGRKFLGMLGNHGTLQQIIIGLSKEIQSKVCFRDYETFTGRLNFIWETPLREQNLYFLAEDI